MSNHPHSSQILSELCDLALSGDDQAESRLFETLRVRFLDVVKQRVPEDDVEDVVQEGLRIVHLKLSFRPLTGGFLPWSYSILRNVVGNYYKKASRRKRGVGFDEQVHGATDEDISGDLERQRIVDHLAEKLLLLSRTHPRCAVLFDKILQVFEKKREGRGDTQTIYDLVRDEFPEMSPGTFYTALHRCRARLRALMNAEAGEEANR